MCLRTTKSVYMNPDISILGAGVIGLSLALELRHRGFLVEITDPRTPLAQASGAAAGMLALEDPHNPPELLPLSRLSGSLYPSFLTQVKEGSGLDVPFQTETTLQTLSDGEVRVLREHSLDPRQLAPALLRAAQRAGVRLRQSDTASPAGVTVHCTGAWGGAALPVTPRKGQMLRVRLPPGCDLQAVHRSAEVYVVPRVSGPQRGSALLGATVEDAGFDLTTTPAALAYLRHLAARLVPGELARAIGSEAATPMVEAWAGVRPATPDGLPFLGALPSGSSRRFVATGHFRNGILLAPATAAVLADLIEGHVPPVALDAFDPLRFGGLSELGGTSSPIAADIRPAPRDNCFPHLP